MLVVSECIAKSALERTESRGGHTRGDFPTADPQWRQVNLITSLAGGEVALRRQPLPEIPVELLRLFDPVELGKYMTATELERLQTTSTEGTA
jgi:succinate dehydrogenase / fumarate reductase, flavoprotein subunit